MDLLNQNYNYNEKPKKSPASRMVIALLIICILLAIVIVILMFYLKSTVVPTKKLQINGAQIEMKEGLIVNDSNGREYINLKLLSELLTYKYNNGEFQKYAEDRTKCYIDTGNEIIGFSSDSSVIYKTTEDSKIDYEYYNLENNIIIHQDELYISTADITKALNVTYEMINGNIININTTQYIADTQVEELKQSGYTITSDERNKKAMAYGMLPVKRDNLWGVLNTNRQEIIGNKYSTMLFDEYNMNYIVSNERNQYGIITPDGNVKVALKYDSLELINHEPVLYKVSQNKKYGIMQKDGTLLTDLEYDKIGYSAEPQNKINQTLIIPDFDGKTGKTIVVYKNNKYGLIYLTNGKTFVECNIFDKIYEVEELGEKKYRAVIKDKTYALEEYLEYLKTQTMVVQ